jgi:hypothetical protein
VLAVQEMLAPELLEQLIAVAAVVLDPQQVVTAVLAVQAVPEL